ncbi:DUF2441 domain-containing protein [Bacillus sp. J37]|uniref:DUF2441 domain-containing protein n=1 Tax=Bacillus sp. J37 TaxID=935837 RepID=UPI000478A7FD|nr:DUF2441 domain-containing protein [Bacillus sp. J37]
MEYIENKIFYHIQTNATWRDMPKLKEGDIFETGVEFNPFYQILYSSDFFQNAIKLSKEYKHLIETNQAFNTNKDTLGYVFTGTEHLLKSMREEIFERIRSDKFSELPSRQKCLWVIPEGNVENLDYWRKVFSKDGGDLLKLSLTGKIHTTNEEFVSLNLFNGSVKNIEESAYKYWNGEKGKSQEETLFEGKAIVVNVLEL